MSTDTCDFLIIGGGIMGLSIARELKLRNTDSDILLIEKEAELGQHASGRNSGVLHAGFYYTADSLKARFTREGNRLLTEYCHERGIPLNACGKVVVAKNEREVSGLDELYARGIKNGVELSVISEQEMHEIDPRLKTCQKALWSPSTATVDPIDVVNEMRREIQALGVRVNSGVCYLSHKGNSIRTNAGLVEAGYVINCAGLYADKIAWDFGFGQQYTIIPFKGLYLYSDEPPGSLKTNVYPVPDLDYPFLGTHFTITRQGRIKIGPTAIPAFWRENYNALENFNFREFISIAGQELKLLFRSDSGLMKVAINEFQKYFKTKMIRAASELVSGVEEKHYKSWGRPGIRAQLLDSRNGKLVMDFCYEKDEHSFHLLNAVSPAFTCALSFSSYITDEIVQAAG